MENTKEWLTEAAFSAGEAGELAGLPYSTMGLWAREGALSPSIRDAAGYGSRRQYSFLDVLALCAGQQCRALDVGLKMAGTMMRFVQKAAVPAESELLTVYLYPGGVVSFQPGGETEPCLRAVLPVKSLAERARRVVLSRAGLYRGSALSADGS